MGSTYTSRLGLSLLERTAVTPRTEECYVKLVGDFVAFCKEFSLSWTSAAVLDTILVDYLNLMFLEGAGGDLSSRLIAALCHVMPELYKQSRALLPRATRCSVGWRRRDPGQMRLPMPRAAALAVAGLLMFWGKPRMAISVALSHVCYLRPSEMIRLKGSDVTPPSAAAGLMYASWGLLLHDATSGRPGKTGMWDESVVLDLDLWIVAPLAALAKIAGSRCMWDFTVAELNALFQRAVVALRLQSLRPHLYAW